LQDDAWSSLAELSSKYIPSTNLPESDLAPNSAEISTDGPSMEINMRSLIQQLQDADDYRDQIVPDGHRTFPEHIAEYGMPC
jgi:hypothetical protein